MLHGERIMTKKRITQEEALALAYYTAQKAKANLEEDQEETQLKVTSEPAPPRNKWDTALAVATICFTLIEKLSILCLAFFGLYMIFHALISLL